MEPLNKNFHKILKDKIDTFVHLIYRVSREFPKEEIYGVTSQIRRAALSIALNYVEGYARNRNLVYINFLEISYGSLTECDYLLDFSLQENYLDSELHREAKALSKEIGAMIWTTIRGLKGKETFNFSSIFHDSYSI